MTYYKLLPGMWPKGEPGTREAVETAIDSSKGRQRSSTWESLAKQGYCGIRRWDSESVEVKRSKGD